MTTAIDLASVVARDPAVDSCDPGMQNLLSRGPTRLPDRPVSAVGVAKRDLEVDGYRIEAGWKGAGAIWATLQDDSTFADPGTFHADRLSDESFGALPANAYVSQGAGAHRCAGEALVQHLMPAFLGWFTRHYDWEYPAQDASPSGQGVGPLPRSRVRGTVTPRS